MLMKLCNHPSLVCQDDDSGGKGSRRLGGNRRAAAQKTIKYADDEKETKAPAGASEISKYMPFVDTGHNAPVHPEFSGKMFVLWRLIKEMRRPGNGGDKIVIVSNYTQTLDLIGRMCRQNSWGFCRLDGSISMKKRQKMVDEFNDPCSFLVAFLLSSKAGGCGLNLIGGNRLVLFDPDWNPAVDKQAAARCWRDGQKKRCFTYRFLATGTVEEKIFQRQLSKEGLQSVVDDKEQVNALSTKDLRNLFTLRSGTPSDTHDKLRCERCQIIHDHAELEAQKVLPKKLAACRKLLDEIMLQEDATYFLKPLDATLYGVSKEEYEKLVKQPMDLGTIKNKLEQPPGNSSAFQNVSGFSKDVNRIFSNVVKVWSPDEDDIADASRRLQSWWLEKWKELVPRLMTMKADKSVDEDTTPDTKAEDDVDKALEHCASINNTRGDDYQEQIGMPDEENMRSWSHHHSTDTVDDPIFRAAMRGCDAVSFVFGLEVTWSLIQERQQQEEDRIALEHVPDEEDVDDDDSSSEDEAKDDDDESKQTEKSMSEEPGPDVMEVDDNLEGAMGSDDEPAVANNDGTKQVNAYDNTDGPVIQKRPRGKAAKGKEWHSKRGEWVPINRDVSETLLSSPTTSDDNFIDNDDEPVDDNQPYESSVNGDETMFDSSSDDESSGSEKYPTEEKAVAAKETKDDEEGLQVDNSSASSDEESDGPVAVKKKGVAKKKQKLVFSEDSASSDDDESVDENVNNQNDKEDDEEEESKAGLIDTLMMTHLTHRLVVKTKNHVHQQPLAPNLLQILLLNLSPANRLPHRTSQVPSTLRRSLLLVMSAIPHPSPVLMAAT